MKKRIHSKTWTPKVKPYELHNIFAHLDEKQIYLRRTKPVEWWENVLKKAKAFNKKYIEKAGNANA